MNRKLFHDHIIYDEMISEQPSPKLRRSHNKAASFIISKSKEKSFIVEKNEEFESYPKETQQRYYAHLRSQNSKQSSRYQPSQNNQEKEQSLVYELDFESYQETQHPSPQFSTRINNDTNIKKDLRYSSRLGDKSINNSAQLPSIHKIHNKRKGIKKKGELSGNWIKQRQKRESDFSLRKSKKEIDNTTADPEILKEIQMLKRSNIKLMDLIHEIRRLEPILTRNVYILNLQKQQLKKLRAKDDLLYSPDFELELDKQLEATKRSQQKIKSTISKKNQIFKKKDLKMTKKIRMKQFIDPGEQRTEKIDIVREHYLCKKREEYSNEDKMVELDKKILQYQCIMEQLDRKIYLGQQENLCNRKIFLEYDISKRKDDYEKCALQIEQEISEMRKQIASTQSSIFKLSAHFRADKKDQHINPEQLTLNEDEEQIDQGEHTRQPELKQQKKGLILKFFKR